MTTTNHLLVKQWQGEIEQQFHTILKKSFPKLKAENKWKQTMWHLNERIIVCLVFGKNKIKFCFFNNPSIKLDKLQRWSQTIYSKNLEIENSNLVDWEYVEELIKKTINLSKW
jgi:hypothetical protein